MTNLRERAMVRAGLGMNDGGALGVTADGTKAPLGAVQGTTENAAVGRLVVGLGFASPDEHAEAMRAPASSSQPSATRRDRMAQAVTPTAL